MSGKRQPKRRLQIGISDELASWLDAEAQRHGLAVAGYVRYVLHAQMRRSQQQPAAGSGR